MAFWREKMKVVRPSCEEIREMRLKLKGEGMNSFGRLLAEWRFDWSQDGGFVPVKQLGEWAWLEYEGTNSERDLLLKEIIVGCFGRKGFEHKKATQPLIPKRFLKQDGRK